MVTSLAKMVANRAINVKEICRFKGSVTPRDSEGKSEKSSKKKRQTSKKFFALAFTFAMCKCGLIFKVHSQRTKEKIFVGVCHLFFDLFHLA